MGREGGGGEQSRHSECNSKGIKVGSHPGFAILNFSIFTKNTNTKNSQTLKGYEVNEGLKRPLWISPGSGKSSLIIFKEVDQLAIYKS